MHSNVQITISTCKYSVIFQYKTGLLTSLWKLWQPHDTTTLNKLLLIQLKGTWLTGCFFNLQSKFSTTLVITRYISSNVFCQLSSRSDMFTKFTIKTVGFIMNKTGSCQCTRAVWYICWNSFYTPQRIDALFTVRISSRLQWLIQIPVRQSKVQSYLPPVGKYSRPT